MLALFLTLPALLSGFQVGPYGTKSIIEGNVLHCEFNTQDISGQGAMHFTLIANDTTFGDYLNLEGLGGTQFRVSLNDVYSSSNVNINYLLKITAYRRDNQDTVFTNGNNPIPLWDCKNQDGVYDYNFFTSFNYSVGIRWVFDFTYLDSYTFNSLQDTLSYNYENSNTYQQGYNDGKSDGYQQGLSEGLASDTTIATISSAIMQVGVLPINLFLAVFNYEILGINISGLIGGALTIACLVIALRTIMGTNKGD